MLATGDDDIIAGAKWLFKTYPNARYISFDQVKAGTIDFSQIRVLWWNYDLETTNELPAIANDPAVVAKINQFYKGGGNLLFNQFAARYFWTSGQNDRSIQYGDRRWVRLQLMAIRGGLV